MTITENLDGSRFSVQDFLADNAEINALKENFIFSNPIQLFEARAAASQYLVRWRKVLPPQHLENNKFFPIDSIREILHDEEIAQCLSGGPRLFIPKPPTIEESRILLNSKKKISLRDYSENDKVIQKSLNMARFDSDSEMMMAVTVFNILSEYYQHFVNGESWRRVGMVPLSEPFHLAHMRYLWEIKQKCDVLFVGLDTDWVLSNRKEGRPIYPFAFRVATLLKMKGPNGEDLVEGVFPIHSMGGDSSNVLFSVTAGTDAFKDIKDWTGLTFFTSERDPEIAARFGKDIETVTGENHTQVIEIPEYCPNVSTTAFIKKFDLRRDETIFSDWPSEEEWRKMGATSMTFGGIPLND